MEENNVEVMENVTITDLDDVKDNSRLAKAVGTGVIVAAVYGVGRLVVDVYKTATTKTIPWAKKKLAAIKSKHEKTPEHESSEEKAETKTEAKESEKKKSKK